MTDRHESSAPGDDRAERLARLRARRGAAPDSLPAPTLGASVTDPQPTMVQAVENVASGSTRRRRPATTAKIVTVGASTTALLGMMAGYGFAGRAAESDTAEVSTVATVDPPPPTVPPAGSAPTTTEPERVVVVIIDATSGTVISEAAVSLLDEAGLDATIDRLLEGGGEPPPVSTTTPPPDLAAPNPAELPPVPTTPTVVAPATVDLAVPEPPPPPPAPAPASAPATASAPAPAPAPAPQAETSGS